MEHTTPYGQNIQTHYSPTGRSIYRNLGTGSVSCNSAFVLHLCRFLGISQIPIDSFSKPPGGSNNGVSFLQTTQIIVLTGSIVIVMPLLHTGRKRAPLLPGTEEPMVTVDFITALFYEVDEQLRAIPKHPKARLWPS